MRECFAHAVAACVVVAAIGGWARAAQVEGALSPEWVSTLRWRSIGPANMSGRITELAVVESDPTTFYVGTASGGLLKTTNAGMTFEHLFNDQATCSIGAVAVAPSDPNIVWVGTGEENPRNSVTWGDGVYKSTDAGATWTNMGLRESFQIGAIVIHPTNPDIVYVGALGRLWGPSEQRGLFKTTDGGATWKKVLWIDDKTGIIDVAMHPSDPNTLLVAAWERERDGFDTNDPAKRWGPGSGLYRTTDGGEVFEKIVEGLPTCAKGRMSIRFYRKNPDVVYLLVDSERIGSVSPDAAFMGINGEDAEVGARLTAVTRDGPAAKAGLAVGDIIVAIDDTPTLSYNALVATLNNRKAEQTATVVASRSREVFRAQVTFGKREGNEKPFSADLDGQRADVHDQQGDDGHETGGLFRSADAGATWTRINSVNPRPMYFSKLGVDPSDENYIYVLGVTMQRSNDGGKTFSRDGSRGVHADHHAVWIDPADGRHAILGTDGGLYVTRDRFETWDHLNSVAIGQFYHVAVDTSEPYRVFGGLQDNGSWGGPSRTRSGRGPVNSDWFRVGGGDGFVCAVDPEDPDMVYYESQNGGMGRWNLRTGERGSIRPRAPRGVTYRFNWKTPFVLSHHNPRIYYVAGNYVFRSVNRGSDPQPISPDITRTERGSASALAESALDRDLLYVGTDDGAIWVTRDGGKAWACLFGAPERAAEEQAEAQPSGEGAARGAGRRRSQPPSDQPADRPAERAPELPAQQVEPPADAPAQPDDRVRTFFSRLDSNGDGRVQRGEVPERMREFFDQADTDKDGTLSLEEFGAIASRFARGGGGGGGARGEAPARPTPAPPAERGEGRRAQPEQPARDALSGAWDGRVLIDVGGGPGTFEMTLRLGEENRVSGSVLAESIQSQFEDGSFDPDTGTVRFTVRNEQIGQAVAVEGKVEGEVMRGSFTLAGGQFTVGFEARRRPVEQPAREGGDRAARAPEESRAPAGTRIADIVPRPMWVSSIEASRHVRDRVYLTIDGHKADDDRPYVLASDDAGESWRSIASNLPSGSARVVREDLVNPDMLYVGTEFAVWVSVNRGASWTKLNSNLPTVAVHEIAQHPTAGEIIAATHGRSLWILDVTALRQMTDEARHASVHLYAPNRVTLWHSTPSFDSLDATDFEGENPYGGAEINYSITRSPNAMSLRIEEADGTPVRELELPSTEPGLHRVAWDLRRAPEQRRGPGPQFGGGQFGGGQFGRGRRVPSGVYRVVLTADGVQTVRTLTVRGDPVYPQSDLAQEEQEGVGDESDDAPLPAIVR